jgi:bla regulator protein BlaR1
MNLAAVGNHLWQSTIFAALAWAVVQVLRKNSARVRYSIWMLSSLKFLLPLSLLIALGGHLSSPAKLYVATVDVRVIEFVGLPFGPSPFQRESLATATFATKPTPNQSAIGVVLTIWLVGAAAVVGSWLIRMRRVWEILGTSRRLDEGREIEALERAKSLRGFGGRIRCATTESVIEPGIHGVFRPILLLPSGVAERLGAGQLDAIIHHELCHIRRYDNLSALIHMVVETLFWFHPLIWWMGIRLVDERERACDEQVLQNGSDPKVYASAILKVCEFYVASPLECAAGVGGGNLRKRIEEIMNHCVVQKLSGGKKLLLAGVGMFALALPIVVRILSAPLVLAQSPASAEPTFEVTSVKPDLTGAPARYVRQTPGRVSISNLTLKDLLMFAYQVKDFQILGGPGWIDSAQYDIEGKAGGSPSQAQIKPMMQALLRDRFKLALHHDTKELPIYELKVAKGGLKLQPLKEGSCIAFDPNHSLPAGQKPSDFCGSLSNGRGRLDATSTTMVDLSRDLSVMIGRTVVDKTGVTGAFALHLTFVPDETMPQFPVPTGDPVNPTPPDDGPSVFAAVQEQLGLKLESGKGPVEVLVIDHVEKPTEN